MGGLERYILNLSMFIPGNNPEFSFALLTDRCFAPIASLYAVPKHQNIGGLQVYRLGPNSASIFKGVLFKFLHSDSGFLNKVLTLSLYHEAARLKEIRDVDVFHVHGIWDVQYPMIGLWLSQRFHRPFVVSLHGDSVNEGDGSMQIKTEEMLNLLQHASVITTYSQAIFSFLNKLGLDTKTRLVPNFVDTSHFFRGSASANSSLGTRIVVVSRLDAFKDPLTILRAFSLARKEIPKARLTFVGDGPLYGKLIALAKELDLEDSVSFVGRCHDVRSLLACSDVFVATRAGYIAALEAWCMGLAVIAPNSGILGEIMSDGENTLFFPNHDPENLSKAMVRLMRDGNLREKLSANGLKSAESYDIHNVAPKIEEIYRSLMS
jgi:teichuronic acid biosynthesis glycosyltransferase TuaC